MSYAKLSIEHLASAFAQEEGKRLGRVFAIFMGKETRRVLQGFLKALSDPKSRWSDVDLWGATFILDERVPSSCILLGVTGKDDGPTVDAFQKAMDFFTTGTKLEDREPPPHDVWSSLVQLF